MKTSIVILTHNQLDITKQCLNSIRKHTPELIELIIVDNNSTDGTVAYLKAQADIKVILNEKNYGFAKGCNQGFEISSGENILFLNNDTVVTENWLGNMLKLLYRDEKIGLVGPVTNCISGPQQIPVTYKDLSFLDDFSEKNCKWQARCFKRVMRLVGFCLLVKRKVLEEIGVFDQRFDLGNYEDDDLCLRAVKKGWHLCIALDSYIHHIGSVTFYNCEDTKYRNLLAENSKIAREKWGFDLVGYLLNTNPEITVSLCMVVKNAEKTLTRTLESVKGLVDEIIIVDLGSKDSTKKIALGYTKQVYDFQWSNDYSAALNFAFEFATMEYVLWLDVGDMFLEEDQEKFLTLKGNFDQNIDAVSLFRKTTNARPKETKALLEPHRYHLVKRLKKFQWVKKAKPYLLVGGNTMVSDISIITANHRAFSLPTNQEELQSEYVNFLPPDLFSLATRLLKQDERAEAIRVYEKFLATGKGWVEDNILACGRIADCYSHFEDQQNNLKYNFRSFEFDQPRAEACCRLGHYFLNLGHFSQATFWYKLATELEKPSDNYGLIYPCWTWLPHIQLCICYDKMQQPALAYHHNEIARTYLPDDPRIVHNKTYLESILNEYKAIKKLLTFVTLFPETENVHLSKDIGMIPYIMYKHFQLDAKVACYKNGDYPYIDNLVNGLKLEFITKTTGDPFIDGVAYLNENAKKIDILNVYHLLDRTLEWAKIYKSLNPTGKVFLKLDANEWYIKQFDINETNIKGSHRILQECTLISVETKELYEYLNLQWPISIKYLPNGFYDFGKREKVHFQQKENIICTVGRIGLYLKANEILLEAFKIASSSIPDWKLEIIGPIETDFAGYIASFFEDNPELVEKVIFTGEISDKDILAQEYKKAKIFCTTSRLESFGLVFAEAASNGCFIITSDVISAKDVTDSGKYGDVFPKEDISQLAQLLIKNCHDDARLATVCDEIQDYAYKKFYWVDICKDIYQLLEVEA